MKNFAEKLIERNYKKRIIAAIIASAVLLALTAALIPLTLEKQISELRALEEERENNEHGTAAEITEEGAKENERQGIKEEKQRHNDKEHEINAMLRKVTPVSDYICRNRGHRAADRCILLDHCCGMALQNGGHQRSEPCVVADARADIQHIGYSRASDRAL